MRRGRSSSPPAPAARRWRRERGSWKPPKAASRPTSPAARRRSGRRRPGRRLLREEYGDGGVAADARLQSFAEREAVLDQIEECVDEELEAQEGALRSIPPGKRYLSAVEQARAAGATGPLTLANRESMVRAGVQQVGEEVDRREEELLAIISGDALLVEAAADALFGDGRTRSLGERWEACEQVKSGVEEELARQETAIRADSAGEEFLHDARLAVLGSADREAATLGDRACIVKAAAAAKRDADEKAARVEALGRQPGGLDLYHAELADRDPKWSQTENTPPPAWEHDEAALAAAEADDTRLKRLRGVLSDEVAEARYREVLDQVAGQFNTADIDSALVAGEREREHLDALGTATEAALAAAARSRVELRDDEVHAIYATGATHAAGLSAVERTTEALGAAADQKIPTETIIDTWNRSAPGGTAAALAAATVTVRKEREAALAAATEAAQAAADRSNVRLLDTDVRAIYATGATHAAGLSAVERTTEALGAAADQKIPTETIIDTWNRSAPGGIVAALAAATVTVRKEREAALAAATEAAQAAADRSNVRLLDTDVRAIYATGATHAAGLAAVERTTEALEAAADQPAPAGDDRSRRGTRTAQPPRGWRRPLRPASLRPARRRSAKRQRNARRPSRRPRRPPRPQPTGRGLSCVTTRSVRSTRRARRTRRACRRWSVRRRPSAPRPTRRSRQRRSSTRGTGQPLVGQRQPSPRPPSLSARSARPLSPLPRRRRRPRPTGRTSGCSTRMSVRSTRRARRTRRACRRWSVRRRPSAPRPTRRSRQRRSSTRGTGQPLVG